MIGSRFIIIHFSVLVAGMKYRTSQAHALDKQPINNVVTKYTLTYQVRLQCIKFCGTKSKKTETMAKFSQMSSEDFVVKLKEIFKQFKKEDNPLKGLEDVASYLTKASVLIPLFFKEGELHVLLTKRSHELTSHAGYVAFPGGKRDDTDKDDIETALRESEEEIGLKPCDVEVIAVFGPGFVRPNTLVTPVIGVISPDFVPVRNEKEVAFVFDLPLKRFLSDERKTVKDFIMDSLGQKTFHVYHFLDTVNGEEVDTWGFTASQCVMVALIAFQSDKQISFVEDIVVTKDTAHKGIYDLKSLMSKFKMKPSL